MDSLSKNRQKGAKTLNQKETREKWKDKFE